MRLLALLVMSLSGCVSNHVTSYDVVPYEKDSYLITGLGGGYAGKEKDAMTQRADLYCSNLHKNMVIKEMKAAPVTAVFGGERATLVFSCVNK